MRRFSVVLVAAAGLLFAGSAFAAHWHSPSQARRALIRMDRKPRPLYPTRIPHKIACCKAEVGGSRLTQFTVSFKSKRHGWLASFGRQSKERLGQYLRQARREGHLVDRERVGGRRVFFSRDTTAGATPQIFYIWHAQHMTYETDSPYGSGVKRRDLRKMVASLELLPQSGHSSHG